MSKFTPSREYVKSIYVGTVRNSFVASTSEIEQEFDRWLNDVIDSSWREGWTIGVNSARAIAEGEKLEDAAGSGYPEDVSYNQAVEDTIRAINELNEA